VGSADKLVWAAKQLPVDSLIYPAAVLPGPEAELAIPRGREKQAAPVEAPAAEHAPHFQAPDRTKSVLGVDADLVFHPTHACRLPAAG
jgi:hypothetical protein